MYTLKKYKQNEHINTLLLSCVLGFILPFFFSTLPSIIWVLGCSVFFFLLSCRYQYSLYLAVIMACFCYANWHLSDFSEQKIPSQWIGKTWQIQGKIVGIPTYKKERVRFTILIKSVQQDIPDVVGKKIILSCFRCPINISANQYWNLAIRVKPRIGYASWYAFDYEKYLFRKKIFASGYVVTKKVKLLKVLPNQQKGVIGYLSDIRADIKQTLITNLSDSPHALSILLALTIGDM